jgi:demethylmenaquinone methyltransferase/2-methoxy-6-polyprenyl-1,4-benzoquinol methylase
MGWLTLKEWPKSLTDKQSYMDPIFTTIASRYDFMTQALSFGQERRWKDNAIGLIPKNGRPKRILDLASGTAEFLLRLSAADLDDQTIGLERNPKMLEIALEKCAGKSNIRFVRGDLTTLPFKNGAFEVVTMGYGLRYVTDIRAILKEAFRLLKSGGIFICLEFGLPKSPLYRRACFGYLLLLGSLCGLLLHGRLHTYWHIVESLRAYPGQKAVRGWLEEVGFREVSQQELLGGISVISSAQKP